MLTHSEAWFVGAHTPMARGWERQIDRGDNPELYSATLSADKFRQWLDRSAVGLVAVPTTSSIDEGGTAETQLLATPPAYLREVWHNADWRLFAVDAPRSIADGPASVAFVDAGHLVVRTTASGAVTVRFRWASRLGVESGPGCDFGRANDQWIHFTATGPGEVHIESMATGTAPKC